MTVSLALLVTQETQQVPAVKTVTLNQLRRTGREWSWQELKYEMSANQPARAALTLFSLLE